MKRIPWFERTFDLTLTVEAFPSIVERLRGTPARLEDRLRSLSPPVLTEWREDKWSIQENAGHLLDLEPLWLGRLDDILTGAEEMRAADLSNRGTYEADHNERPIKEILAAFRHARGEIVDRLDSLSEEHVRQSSLHPRLRQGMSVLDLSYFVAEHDDHHLARITEIVSRLGVN